MYHCHCHTATQFVRRTLYGLRLIRISACAITVLDPDEMMETADEINTLARSVTSTSGVHFVTTFSGLLAPYWE